MAEELCRSAGESRWWYSSADASSPLSYKESISAPPPPACDISIVPREEAYDAIKLQQFFHRPQFSTFNWTAHDQPFLLNGWRSGENGSLVHGDMLQMEDHHASTAVRDIFPFEQHRICNEFGSMERIKAQPQYCAFGTTDDDQVAIQLPPVPLMHVPSSWNSLSQLLKSTTLMAQKQHESSFNNQLQFGRNTTTTSPFWNASFIMEPKAILRNPTATINSGGDRESCSSSTQKTESKPAVKKPRIGTPSPLPTFKVRKEKLGDRITALQQLVSPFGKTDTASVLQEAFEYIKFLHDQVSVLSSPYLKSSNGHSTQQTKMISDMYNSRKGDEGKRVVDLRSRGLSLVPIASTFPVVSETASPDFWHPALLGATFR